jgi:hypothetical protein
VERHVQWGVVGGWVGKVSKAKKKPGGGRGENKVPKKNWEGGGKKIKLQKKTEIRAEKGLRKGKQKKVKLGWDGRKKRESYQCTIHPRWCTGGCCFTLARSHKEEANRAPTGLQTGAGTGHDFMELAVQQANQNQ